MSDQTAQLEWRDGTIPVSIRFDDPYFSLAGGLDETRHVFLAGNDLPNRYRDGFHIAELGFGTGLSMLTALQAFDHGTLHFTSFEAYPMARTDIEAALKAFPDLDPAPLLDHWPATSIRTDRLHADIIIGDARETLPSWTGKADAWFLDGFSPAKNPELWSPELMLEVGTHTAPNGTFATYTAAGHVRRSLTDAGFDVERVQGFGRKRHMSVGRLR
ncbi:tRNA U34 5-methylaminomethyl-2-thiouridine-forming methyltransferase MnmC [Litoreibacter ascidiaceicola]|uniref:tRNA U34 5-methylaminomethyl-2-thiouridine-forming methyltransferase MnmC n=1 Tax=Litoreibacter ascidiaceicola TaxID=1486859 RepID=A0A1M5AN84_9RHOB|nr:tRNA (5-methylaminomethyl-2-thiouridine)(34)-methyltransferase MnmD [Litoreibacter ascidiaceicola]SHF31635.1 tRNA U34 5-methylaminomethyl-2-thiouridine-forming methyltransferase MnmC [Litoreibacter ascidiaceicola]